jgi:uncharacterized protein (DUF2267 family)/HSP20 family molecular chaperone IbpA
MNYDEFLSLVGRQTGLSEEAAERAVRATLVTLAERLSSGEARQLAAELPGELLGWLYTQEGPEPFDADEFLRRVARREGVDIETADWHARVVFTVLRRAASPAEIADVSAELPEDLRALLWNVPVMPGDAFLERVADQAGLDRDGARRATEAVLESLAERIAAGDVQDLIARLPVSLHEPLKRGLAHSSTAARTMPPEVFLERVAEREGVPQEQAQAHTQAVFTALREAVPEEFFDIAAQLSPDEMALYLPRRPGANHAITGYGPQGRRPKIGRQHRYPRRRLSMALPVRRQTTPTPSMAQWDPISTMQRLSSELGRFFEDDFPSILDGEFVPMADVEETDDAFLVEVELPGVKKDDIDISLAGGRLVITGERKERERTGILRRQTRTVGRFRYEIMLPGDVDESGVSASLDEGVLTVRVPKASDDRPRRIEVK